MLDLTREALIARIEDAVGHGRFAEARTALEEAVRRFGGSPVFDELRRRVDEVERIAVEPQLRALVRQAQEEIRKADYRAAGGALRRALGLKPDDREARRLLTETEKAELRRRRAIERDEAVRRRAREIGGVLARGDLAAGRGELEAAGIEHGKHPDLSALWRRLEELEGEARRRRTAELVERARELLAAGNLQGAREEAERALRRDGDNRAAREIAAEARAILEREEERRHHERAVAAARRDVERLIAAGELGQASQRLRQAADQLGREAAFDELEGRLRKARDDLRFRQRIEWAERRANEAARLIDEAARRALKGEYGAAVERLEAARRLDPSHPEIEDRLATVTAARERQLAERRRVEQRAARARAAAHSWEEAFRFPFRGRGPAVFWGGLALLVLLDVLSLLPAAGIVFAVLRLLVPVAACGFLPAVVRATAAGGNQLPEWHELADGRRWAADLARFLAVAAAALSPLALWLATRRWHGALGAESGPPGWLLSAALIWLGSAAIVLAGVAAALGRFPGSFRSHLRTLTAGGIDLPIAIGALFALAVIRILAGSALATAAPWLDVPLAAAVEVYGLFTVPHLIGVAVRRHRSELAPRKASPSGVAPASSPGLGSSAHPHRPSRRPNTRTAS